MKTDAIRRKPGRPNRDAATKKALANIDLTTVDAVAILREIASDRSTPASARVAACKALLALDAGDDDARAGAEPDEIS
ncbi:MAG: hypothetical protein ACREE9_07160, partial [Stellaceae bacterium]